MKRARAAAALVAGWAFLGSAASTKPLSSPATLSPKVIHDNEAYPAGAYLAYIAPFNKGALIYDRDYTESITVDAAVFPAQSLFSWRWPDTPASAGVYGFSAIDFGDYNNTAVPTPIPARRVGQIRTLNETHDASFAGLLEGFDVIDDLFLTGAPDDNTTNLFEVEVFLHTPRYSADYVRGTRRIGNFVGAGIIWTVAIDESAGHIPDILFMPHDRSDIGSGTVDLRAMLAYLVDARVIPATVYFNGFAFGTETQRGAGEMRVTAFAASYE
jgi:hypothetical protein